MIGITSLTFLVSHVIPADPARAAAGLDAREEQVKRMREIMGLDRPLYEQYVLYLMALARGDLGISARSMRPVREEIGRFFPATAELVLLALLLAAALGIPLGVASAIHRGRPMDRIIQGLVLTGMALPTFWLALLLQLVFFRYLGLFPAEGRLDFWVPTPPRISGLYVVDSALTGNWPTLVSTIQHIMLPAWTLSLTALPNFARITHRSVASILAEDYVRTARSKGLTERTVLYRHVLRNAAVPIITIGGLQTGWLLSGTVVVEVVFSWPGMGRYAVEAISFLDFQTIMGIALVMALVFLAINLVVDALYVAVDPRVRNRE